MSNEPHKTTLIRELANLLRAGIDLNREVCHYIDSTLAPSSAGEFVTMLTATDNCEAETVIELIFFPDQAMQEQLEPSVGAAGFSKEDEWEIAEKLCRAKISAPIRFPDHRGEARVGVSESAIGQLVARLNLTTRLAPAIAQAIDQAVSGPETACRIRVKLRNARIMQSGNQIDFICRLIQQIFPKNTDEFWKTLDLAIYLLEQIKADADIYGALMAHKKLLVQSLQAAEKNREALASNTVEALIMSGTPIISICVDSARETIGRIDRISLLIYGKTESFPFPETVRQTVDLADADKGDIGAIMRLLNS